MNDFEGMDPETLQALMDLGIEPDRQKLLELQLQQANKLRNTEVPSGGMAGRVYVANPWGALAAGYDRYRGAKDYKKATTDFESSLQRQSDARNKYLQSVLRGYGSN